MENIKFRYAFRTIDGRMLFYFFSINDIENGRLQEASLGLHDVTLIARDMYSHQTDMKMQEIYENDILEIEEDGSKIINVVCKFGIATRVMESGLEVDIPSFYLEKSDGFKSFPIVRNWQFTHDLNIINVIGNIYEMK